MSTPSLGCTRAPSRRVPCTVRGYAPRAGLGVWDFTGERTASQRALYSRGLAVTVPETPYWPVEALWTGTFPPSRVATHHTLFAVWDEPWFGEPEGT